LDPDKKVNRRSSLQTFKQTFKDIIKLDQENEANNINDIILVYKPILKYKNIYQKLIYLHERKWYSLFSFNYGALGR
jgi:hypothetical protein